MNLVPNSNVKEQIQTVVIPRSGRGDVIGMASEPEAVARATATWNALYIATFIYFLLNDQVLTKHCVWNKKKTRLSVGECKNKLRVMNDLLWGTGNYYW